MHWGNIGSFLSGLSTVIIAVAVLIRSPGALRDWRARQREQGAAARAQAGAAAEDAKAARLDRQRRLYGWSAAGTGVHSVALVTDPEEIARAARSLASGHPGGYVLLRSTEGEFDDNALSAHLLRELIERDGCVTRMPTVGEREAIETGLDTLGIPHGNAVPGSPKAEA